MRRTVILVGMVLACVFWPSWAFAQATGDVAADALAARILQAAGVQKGICIDLGCGSGELALAILNQSELFVHALETDDARVHAARLKLEGSGLYGKRVAVEKGSLSRLPYPDYCANVIVRGDMFSDGAKDLNWKEVLRVLRPGGGLAFLGQSAAAGGKFKLTAEALREQLAAAGVKDFEIIEKDGVWVKIRRARPKGMGDWSHDYRCNPGNNPCAEDDLVRVPFQTLWIAGPRSFTKYGYPLISNGRVFLRHGGMTFWDSRWKPSKQGDLVQAFDAYNGVKLWERRMDERHGNGFVAVGEGVYLVAGTTLYALNAADGSVRWKRRPEDALAGMKDWARYSCADGVVVASMFDQARNPKLRKEVRKRVALVGLSVRDGELKWKLQPEGGVGSVAIAEGKVFRFGSDKQLRALNITTGEEAWKVPAQRAGALRYYRGKLYTSGGVFSAADGKFLSRHRPKGILVGDRAFVGKFKGGVRATDLETGKPVKSFPVPQDPYCPKTGIPQGCKFMYGRCVRPTASTHCFFLTYGGTVIADLIRNELFPTEAFRSNCRTGVIAGSGLVYNSPSGCKCAFAVRGGVALLPVDEAFYWAKAESSPTEQLERGPAYGQDVEAADSGDDWPGYRHNPARNNVTPARLALPLRQSWQAKLPDRITPPAVAGGMVFVGCDNHSAYALDAATGEVRWRFRTGGPVWVTPTHWRGRVYVGSMDGWVYCLRADSGKLIWRFRGAPHERKMFYQGRPLSLWPVAGGIIVERGIANFYAGYCSHDRVFLYALDAKTGRQLWVNDKAGRAVDVTGPAGGISPHGVSPSGIMAASEDILYVPHGMFAPAAFRRSDGKLLWWGRRGDSTQRSNINLQNLGGPNLSLGGGILFMGGPGRRTGAGQPFFALDARTGRFWGADDPRLAGKAGRGPNGESLNVKRGLFGTYAIKLGSGIAPVVVGDGIFTFGYRGSFDDLKSYLATQFPGGGGRKGKWPNKVPPGTLIVTAGKVVACNGQRLEAVARADGSPLWRAALKAEGKVLANGLAAAGGRLYAATNAGEIVCFGPQ